MKVAYYSSDSNVKTVSCCTGKGILKTKAHNPPATVTYSKSEAVAASWKDWLKEGNYCLPGLVQLQQVAPLSQTLIADQARKRPLHSKDLRGNPKPRVSPDRTGPKPVRGRGTFLRIFSGRVGSENFISSRSGSGNFISGRSRSGYFLPGCETLSPGISGINLLFIPKLRK